MAKSKKKVAPKSRPAAKAQPQDVPALTPGTVLKKLDRAGKTRCECTVEADGYKYKGTVYSSLSGAAAAAAKDLGLTGTSFNGYVFWGLTKPGRATAVDRLEHLWNRYNSAAVMLLKGAEKVAPRGSTVAKSAPRRRVLVHLRSKFASAAHQQDPLLARLPRRASAWSGCP